MNRKLCSEHLHMRLIEKNNTNLENSLNVANLNGKSNIMYT